MNQKNVKVEIPTDEFSHPPIVLREPTAEQTKKAKESWFSIGIAGGGIWHLISRLQDQCTEK